MSTPVVCAWISKDGIAMWPTGCAIVPHKAWHRSGRHFKSGFYEVELIVLDEYSYVYRIFDLSKMESIRRFKK